MIYTVKPGDTLTKIAQMTIGGEAYVPAIANLNNIENPNLIYVGQQINIPDTWLKPGVAETSGSVPSLTPTITSLPVPVSGQLPRPMPGTMPVTTPSLFGIPVKWLIMAGIGITIFALLKRKG